MVNYLCVVYFTYRDCIHTRTHISLVLSSHTLHFDTIRGEWKSAGVEKRLYASRERDDDNRNEKRSQSELFTHVTLLSVQHKPVNEINGISLMRISVIPSLLNVFIVSPVRYISVGAASLDVLTSIIASPSFPCYYEPPLILCRATPPIPFSLYLSFASLSVTTFLKIFRSKTSETFTWYFYPPKCTVGKWNFSG